MKISQRVSLGLPLERLKFTKGYNYVKRATKGHNSVKTVDAVIVLNLCISSEDSLYLYKFSRKYLTRFQSY